jgi:phenylalanyl-tRNA synthetase beta chain
MYGYDNIKSAPMEMPLVSVEQIPTHTVEYQIKHTLASMFGLNEVHTYLWNYIDYNKQVGINQESVLHLMDSSISGQSGIRKYLAPSIIKIADENKNKFGDIGIFEIARVVDGLNEENIAIEKKKLAIVLASESKTEKELYFATPSVFYGYGAYV